MNKPIIMRAGLLMKFLPPASADTKKMKNLSDLMKLCKELEDRHKRMMSSPDTNPSKTLKIQVTKDALEEALRIMERILKSNKSGKEGTDTK